MKHDFKGGGKSASTGLQRLLDQAVALHQAGNIQQAQAFYQQILEQDPHHPDALHLLGVIALQVGRHDIAEKLISQAIQNNRKTAAFHNNLGNAVKGQGRLEEAARHYRQALKLNPTYPEALNNLGTVQMEQGELEQAADTFRKALRLKPNYDLALNNLGNVLQKQDNLEAAVEYYRRALALNPANSSGYSNLGAALKDLGRTDEAIECFEQGLRLDPRNCLALNNLGLAHKTKGEVGKSIEYLDSALRLCPDYAEAHYNYSLALLLAGNLAQGWTEYEWRLRQSDAPRRRRKFPQQWWNGEALTGKTLLIWEEQGVGDEILFANALGDALQTAKHCVIECDRRLVPLFSRSFPSAEVVPRAEPVDARTLCEDIDYQTPAGTLSRWFRGTLEQFPAQAGYLAADPVRTAFWRDRLAGLGAGIKVGICWRSMLQSSDRNKSYTELTQWKPILMVPGAVFINLQYDNCSAELAKAQEELGAAIHAWADIDLLNDLDEAAALTSALDLVISPATSVAAMAGALGVPVWQLSPPDNWPTLGTGRMPWYPGMRVFFQADGEPWEAVIERITEALRSLAGGSG